MTTPFTNRSGGTPEEAEAYIRETLELVGDKDPVAVMADTSRALAALVDGLSDEQLGRPEAPGKWSIAAVLRHLLDAEEVWGFRMKQCLAESPHPIQPFDQDAWATAARYLSADPHAVLAALAPLRAVHMADLAALTAEDLAKVSHHPERGPSDLAGMILFQAGHDLGHLRQIGRIRKAVS